MEHNELLLAISDLIDKKLDTINYRLDCMNNSLTNDIRMLEARIDVLDVKLSGDIKVLNSNLNAVGERLKSEIKKNQITLEKQIVPQLKRIEKSQ